MHSCLFVDGGAARRASQEEGASVKSKGVLASCSADGTLHEAGLARLERALAAAEP